MKKLNRPDERLGCISAGTHIVVLADTGSPLAQVQKSFSAKQASISVISCSRSAVSKDENHWTLPDITDEQIKSLLKEIVEKQGDIDGFLYLPEKSEENGLMPFLFAKHLSRYFHRSVHPSRKTFMVAASLDGQFGMTGSQNWAPAVGALTGLVKTLHQEWPWVFTRMVDLSPEVGLGEWGEALLAEWTDADVNVVEVGISNHGRQTIEFEEMIGADCV